MGAGGDAAPSTDFAVDSAGNITLNPVITLVVVQPPFDRPIWVEGWSFFKQPLLPPAPLSSLALQPLLPPAPLSYLTLQPLLPPTPLSSLTLSGACTGLAL